MKIHGIRFHDRILAYFASEDVAIQALKKIRNTTRIGIEIITDTDKEFKYQFGWEETQVSFKIVEFDAIEDVKDFVC